jgi:hypothetical protein
MLVTTAYRTHTTQFWQWMINHIATFLNECQVTFFLHCYWNLHVFLISIYPWSTKWQIHDNVKNKTQFSLSLWYIYQSDLLKAILNKTCIHACTHMQSFHPVKDLSTSLLSLGWYFNLLLGVMSELILTKHSLQFLLHCCIKYIMGKICDRQCVHSFMRKKGIICCPSLETCFNLY